MNKELLFNGKNIEEVISFLSDYGFSTNLESNGKLSVKVDGKDLTIFNGDIVAISEQTLEIRKPNYVFNQG